MKSALLTLLLVLAAMPAVAQHGGTVESRYGIGEIKSMTTARHRGMGGAGLALPSSYDISLSNPASWTSLDQLRLEMGLSFEHLSFSSNASSVSNGAVDGFQLVIPLSEVGRFRLATGLLPLSRSSYKAKGVDYLDEERYTVQYEGSGGISQFRVGAAVEPVDGISIGAAYQYYFGTIEQSWELAFDNTQYFDSRQRRATNHNGSGFLLGLNARLPWGVTLAAAVSPKTSLKAARNMVFEYRTEDSTVSGATATQTLPTELSLGLSWQATNTVLFAVDYRTRDWTGAEIFDGKQSELTNSYNLNAGVEWMPFKEDIGSRTLSRTAFRLGFSLHQPYVTLQGNDVQEYHITTGAGFPIFAGSRADVAFSWGRRTEESPLYGTGSIIRLSMTVSVGESWFIRHRD